MSGTLPVTAPAKVVFPDWGSPMIADFTFDSFQSRDDSRTAPGVVNRSFYLARRLGDAKLVLGCYDILAMELLLSDKLDRIGAGEVCPVLER